MVYRFRVILDAEEDVFRDIEILKDSSLEDFHNSITQAFGFEGNEMASFYISNEEWEQGEEIALFDMSESGTSSRLMHSTEIQEVVSKEQTKLIYIYDYLSMWTFMVELADIGDIELGREYPNLMFAHGVLPESAPQKSFEAEIDLDLSLIHI